MSTATALAPEDRFSGGFSGGQTTLWLAAALVATGAHVGGALWALRQPPSTPASDSAPAAVMIDLAPEPVAPPAPEQAITPDRADAPEVPDAAEQPLPPAPTEMAALPAPETPPPPPTRTEIAEPLPDSPPPGQTLATPPSDVASPRPKARPEAPPPARTAEPEREPVPSATSKPSQAARKAAVAAPPAPTAAAPRTSAGGAEAASPREWQARLMAHLERRKRYPPGARGKGVVHVRFSIDDQGRVLSGALARSSGFAEFDEAALALVRRASPVPAPPPGAPRDITAPIVFRNR